MHLLYVKEIVERVRPCVVCVVGLAKCCLGNIVVDDIRMECMRHSVDERRCKIDTEVRTEGQSFQRFDVDIGVAEETPVVEVVVLVLIKLTERVLAVAHSAYRSCECSTILLIYRYRWRHLQCVLHRRSINLLVISQCEVLADGYYLVNNK